MVAKQEGMPELKMDPAGIYHEDIYSDRKTGTIRTLSPVKSDGSPDISRQVVFVGETQILTNMGALPVTFEIAAKTLEEAVAKFGDAAKEGVERTIHDIQELHRQAASSIVVPQGGLPPMAGGGGKIQMP